MIEQKRQMMKKTKLLSLIVLLLGLAACTQQGGAHKRDGLAVYLDKAALLSMEFQPAPAPGSAIDLADLSELHDWQVKRTAEQCSRAAAEGEAYFEQFFGQLKPFTGLLPEESKAFILRVREDASTAVTIVKDRNARPRPFLRDAALSSCIGRINGFAYPSGHSVLARVYALLLSEIIPERRAEFMARADAAALSRVITGVHHPSDIEAGKRLGDILFKKFMENAQFRANMDTLRPYAAK